jgi:hypothetical protein
VSGGIYSKTALVNAYNNNGRFRAILQQLIGVDAQDISEASDCTIYKSGAWQSTGYVKYGNSTAHTISYGGKFTVYTGPSTSRWASSSFAAYCGHTGQGKEFAVMKNCGNPAYRAGLDMSIKADCNYITVTAINRLSTGSTVTGTLYINNAKYQALSFTSGNGHTVKITTPESYKRTIKITVTAIIAGKTISAYIPANCNPPKATCDRIEISPTEGIAGQTDFSFATWGTVKNTSFTNFKYDWTSGSIKGTSGWKPGSSTRISTKIAQSGTYSVRGTLKATNIGEVTSDKCTGTIVVKNAPSADCKTLIVTQVSRTQYKLTANASVADGAKVTGYVFTVKSSDGKTIISKTVDSTDASYSLTIDLPDNTSLTADATYNASVTVKTSVGDKTSTGCAKQIVIPKKPVCTYNPKLPADDPNCQAPSATCSLLAAPQLVKGTTYKFTASATAAYGATVSAYVYTVKDNDGKVITTKTNNSNKLTDSIEIELPANSSWKTAAKYNVSVVVKTSLGDKTATACSKTVEVPPKPVCPYNPELPSDDANCKPKCEIAGKENLFKDDPNCKIDMCEIPGKENLTLDDPNCKTDKCEIPGKEDLNKDDPSCKPCDEKSDDENCLPVFLYEKIAVNESQGGVDAATVVAKAGDRIIYTLKVTNAGGSGGTTLISDPLADILEYADLVDNGGGYYDENSKSLDWKDIELEPGDSATHSFTVVLKDPIPADANGQSNNMLYDCVMNNQAGIDGDTTLSNGIDIRVDCPPIKTVEQIVEELPVTGPGENILFCGVVAAIVVFFYARSKQLGKEVRLVRREFNSGAL